MNTTSLMVDFSLKQFQELNREIYGRVNGRNFELPDMMSRLVRYSGQLAKIAREDEGLAGAGFCLAMSLSWAFAIANRLDIDVEEECLARFEAFGRTTLKLASLQEMLAGVQEKRSSKITFLHLLASVLLLVEQVARLDEILERHRASHDPRLFTAEVIPRLLSVVHHICFVSSKVGLKLAEEMDKHFSDGCHQCHKTPCDCGYSRAMFPSTI
jgi:hypothetical protein